MVSPKFSRFPSLFLLLTVLPQLLPAQTAVTLSTSPNPSIFGAPVVLTAAVSPPNATGRVTFYDGVTILGINPLSSGTASISTILLPAGSRKLRAFYRDDANSIVGTSNVISQTVKAVAGGAFSPLIAPFDTASMVMGDFNGDGKVDLAFASRTSTTIRVALGKGDGTFQPPVDYGVASPVTSLASGDFNGDGIADLAVCTFTQASPSTGSSVANVSILLGNGDGTFRTLVTYPAESNFLPVNTMTVGDFNSDGRADLVLAYAYGNNHGLNILLGNGDGTFGAPAAYSDLGAPLVAADFNGDGKPDLALENPSYFDTSSRSCCTPVSPAILLGKGDGTAQTPIGFSPGSNVATVFSLVSGDFNGDGIADLAVGGDTSGMGVVTTWILLGNGDGTFQTVASYPLGSAVASGDFNGDGVTDLVLADFFGNMVGILQGKGDGTFQQGLALPAGAPLAVADFNGDGKADILTANSDKTLTVLLGATSVSFQLTATGGTPQSARVGSHAFPLPLQVTLLHNGVPVPGATVTFTAPPDGVPGPYQQTQPSAYLYNPAGPATALTNASGVASVGALSNSVAGSYLVTASYQGAAATFSLSNINFSLITASGGTPQSATIGAPFPNALAVTVTDSLGNPVSGATVKFTAPDAGASASLSSAAAMTDASGVARVTAIANTIAGNYTVTADAGNLSASFSLTNVAASPGSITASGGTPQATAVGTAFGSPLQVTVKDSGGNLVSGATVTFAMPGAGPSAAGAVLSSTTAVTNASGVASVTATANNVAGSYVVTASVGAFSAAFSLTNLLAASVTLATGTNPSVFGAPVTLTATVTPPNATGRVTFYDGVTILGTKPLSLGTASISTILLPAGTRKLTAFYNGGVNYASPTSNVVTQRVSAVAGGGFAIQSPLSVSPAAPTSVAVGDFNGDGKADFVFTGGTGSSTVTVVLGRADGSFQTPASYTVGANPRFVAVGDFDGDGIPDLAVSGSVLNILLGNGDGTFRPGASYSAPALPVSVADFNSDGIADLAVGNTIWIGNGDGTFHPQNSVAQSSTVEKSVVSDINGDGKPDLVLTALVCGTLITPMGHTQTFCSDNAFVYLGNGDGTFQSPLSAFQSQTVPTAFASPVILVFAVADFNGDGKPDIAYWDGGALDFLPGKGDGTFGPPIRISASVGGTVTSLITGDFNGDGIMDVAAIAVTNSVSTVNLLIGNGDGSFQPSGNQAAAGSANAVAVADFNGDGKADLIIANAAGGSMSVLLGAAPGSGFQLTIAGGTPQSARTGGAFAVPLAVTLLNNGVPVSGATVTFSAPINSFIGSAILSSTTAVTNASGVASVTAIANEFTGSYAVTATAQGLIVSFSLTNTGSQITSVTPSGTPQSTTVGTAFPVALQVTVQGVGFVGSGVVVRFTAPASGASAVLSSATAVTNDSGIASVTATANNIAGSYTVTAIVGDGAGALTTQFALFNLAGGASNLAQGKTATQSSTLPGYPTAGASAAVDGTTDGNFFDGSVTATNADPNAWWQVDLGASAAVNSVAVWNRTDCCGSRLSDYWVFVSDTPFGPSDTPTTLQSRPGTFSSHQTAAPNPSTIIAFGGARGRYVRVQLTGADYLSLAEVQVMGTPGSPPGSNLAPGKLATQSSSLAGYATASAASAVDGNTDGNFFDGSVTATSLDSNAWWQVDLGASAAISSVVVWNRTDCCSNRLSDYWVFISDTPFLPTDTPATLQNRAGTFANHQTAAPNPSTTIAVGAQGRYVRVQPTNPTYLSLAEVQVFGTPVSSSSSNLAQGKTATQSSMFPGYATDGAAAAVDGNTDGQFFDGSVTATNLDANSWWQVDLGASAAVGSIVVWNRTDCCSSRLNDYWVFVSDTPFGPADTPATLQGRAGTFSSHQTATPNPSATIAAGAQGRYVRVQLTGANYLSLAEVQVFGQ